MNSVGKRRPGERLAGDIIFPASQPGDVLVHIEESLALFQQLVTLENFNFGDNQLSQELKFFQRLRRWTVSRLGVDGAQ